MTVNLSALSGLIPAAAATALVIQSLRKRHERRRSPAPLRESAPVSMPWEPGARPAATPDPAPAPARLCRSCGTEVPPHEDLCAICERKARAGGGGIGTTLLHWAVFLAMMAAILGLGYALSP